MCSSAKGIRMTKGSHHAVFLLGAFLALSFSQTEAIDNLPKDYCRDMPLGGYKRHPNDCSRYVTCSSTTGFDILPCQKGLLYDEKAKICNYAALVACDSSPLPVTTPEPLPTRRQRPVNRRPITRPRNERPRDPRPRGSSPGGSGGRVRQDDAMVHAVHNEDLSGFITALNRLKTQRQPEVPRCLRDGIMSDNSDCRQYFICSFGTPYTFQCPPGTKFSTELSRCEFPSHIGPDDPCSNRNDRRGNEWEEEESESEEVDNEIRNEEEDESSEEDSTEEREERTNSIDREDMIDLIADFFEEGKRRARDQVMNAVNMESKMAGQGRAGQGAFRGVANFLGSTNVVKQMSLAAEQQLNTLKIIKEKFHLTKEEIKMVMEKIRSSLDPNPSQQVVPDNPKGRIKMTLNTCPFPDQDSSRCNANNPFRSMDGTCNNLKHPLWGRSMTPLTRFLDPDYCDNIGCPRRSVRNHTLPSGRLVSWKLFDNKADTSHVHTLMLMTFGQLLDHDLTKTALTMVSTDAAGDGVLSEVTCGDDGCSTDGQENRACMPIEIPVGDNAFGDMRCLMFVRTQEVPKLDCTFGARQQVNQLSHYMDVSHIYGSSKEEADALRSTDTSRGILKETENPNPKYKPLLLQEDVKDCRDTNDTIKCFKSGDERVNENVALTGLHVVFMRMHNQIEEQLHDINPHWGGERLFQETRKIVSALWQHIVYNEYIPIILGPQAMARYGLTLTRGGQPDVYDESVSAEIANVFATAAFRFSHSMIADMMQFGDNSYNSIDQSPLSKLLRRPYEIYNNRKDIGSGVDTIMHGILAQPAMRIDRHFSKEITEHLFAENPPHGPGTDLGAINIQRGRDHGLPSYNTWRKWCHLSVANTFGELSDIEDNQARRILRSLYDDVDDIDLFPAAISEKAISGGIVGPTFACILGRQFRNLKAGDRFWYERPDPVTGFNLEQLKEIRKITLSKLICEGCDQIDMIQKYAMLRPISDAFKDLGGQRYAEVYSLASLYHGEQNERKSCDALPAIDLNKWKE